MSNKKNKVKFGLKNVYYAPVTFANDGTPSFDTPIPIPGAVNLSLNRNGETLVFYADDGVYFELANNSGFNGDLEIALVPESFRTGPLGETLDENGVLTEGAEQEMQHFALLFEFTEDVKAVRHALYNCTASQNEVSGATRGENIEVQTEKLNLNARPLPGGGPVKVKTGETTTDAVYDGWYDSVYFPSADDSGGDETTGDETTGDETTGG